MDSANTEALRINDAILAEKERAAEEGVTISQAEEPRDTFLAGYLSACSVCARIARIIPSGQVSVD